MKIKIILSLIVVLLVSMSCKKDDNQPVKDITLEKKYAKYATRVFKEITLKNRIAVLSKAEPIDLLAIENNISGKKDIQIAKIKLSDDVIGYIKLKDLADKPIIFVRDTKAYLRNNMSSKIIETIPRGTLGFIIEEKANWIKVYIGKIKDKWITKQWVKDGFSTDANLIIEARTYEEATGILNSKNKKKKEEIEDARLKLIELKKSSSFIAELADEKLKEIADDLGKPENEITTGDEAVSSDDEENE